MLILVSSHLWAQDSRDLAVNELWSLGIAHSLEVQSSQIDLDLSKDNLADKRTARIGDISVGVIGGYTGGTTLLHPGSASSDHSRAPYWSQNYTIELWQPIYQGGRLGLEADKAALEGRIAKLALVRDIAQIKLVLMRRYLDLLRFYKQQQVISTSISEARQRLHDIRTMERNGMVTSSDVLRSELQLSNYELSLKETNNNIAIISTQIDIALGLDESTIIVPDESLLKEPLNIMTYDRYVEQAYDNYPELRIAQANIDIARKEHQISRSTYLPQIALRGSNTLARPYVSASAIQDMYATNWNVNLSLSYNLSSLYHNRPKVNMARKMVLLRDIEQQNAYRTIRENIKTDHIRHNEALERIATLQISVEQANENYRIVLNKYQNHIAILTDLLDASSLQLDAQLQLTTAKATAIYTYYQLLRSSGNL